MTPDFRRVVIEQTTEKACEFAATLFRTIVCETVGQRGSCAVALAGGTTPRSLYMLLSQDATTGSVPWRALDVFFGDERDVPHDNVDSNYWMAQRTLLDHLPIEPARVHPMPADADDLRAAAERYEQDIRQTLPVGPSGLPRFDLILLGVGGDGHTASLFPGTEALAETKRLVVAQYVPVLGRKRMTFTYPLINAASTVLMLITGDDKAPVVATMLGENEAARRSLPAGGVAPESGRQYMILDAAAARLAQAPA